MGQEIQLDVRQDAELTNAAIQQEAGKAAEGERQLDRSYARLAGFLGHFKKIEGWRFVLNASGKEFGSMAQYIGSLCQTYGRSSGQLWAYTEVGDKLLPQVGETKLDQMGVSKAFELVRASKQAKQPITPELIEAALDASTTIRDVRAAAHVAFDLAGTPPPSGKWVDMGGFYADENEIKELKEFWEIAKRVLEIPKEAPEWRKRRDAIMAAIKDFNGTYAHEVYGQTDGGQQ